MQGFASSSASSAAASCRERHAPSSGGCQCAGDGRPCAQLGQGRAHCSEPVAAAAMPKRVDANLFASSSSASGAPRTSPSDERRQSVATATMSSDESFERRLEDAVSKKRLAREMRHREQRRQQRSRQLGQARLAVADSQPATARPDAPALVAALAPGTIKVRCANAAVAATSAAGDTLIGDQRDSESRSILESLKCASYPIFSRLLPARTSSSPAIGGGGLSGKTNEHYDEQERAHERRDVASTTAGRTRQTVSQAVSAPSSGPARARDKKTNQTASLKLNWLLAESFGAGTAMLPPPPPPPSRVSMSLRRPISTSSTRRHQHHLRLTQSVHVKPSACQDAPWPAAALTGAGVHSGGTRGGNYAHNLSYEHHQHHQHHQRQQQHNRRELAAKQVVRTIAEVEREQEERELAADVDGGYAWVILAVVFIINASTWGTARAYGQIFDKLAREDSHSRTEAAMPFTIMGAVENMAGPVSGCLLALTKSWRLTVVTGSCLITLAHLFAGLSDDWPTGQLLSMGLMCGFGLSLVCISFFQVNNAYFVRYRNTAFGVGMTGAAFGTLIISPMCQYFLDNYEGTRMCYLMLALAIAPNIPLALLLKPKGKQLPESELEAEQSDSLTSSSSSSSSSIGSEDGEADERPQQVASISSRVERRRQRRRASGLRDPAEMGIWTCVKLVIGQPLFHLIWPTQLIFCWFNFVFGMILVDFGKDRGLDARHVAHLVPCWAFGQLFGRLFLSSLVDLKFLTYKSFTIVCFLAIGLTTFLLNGARLDPAVDSEPSAALELLASDPLVDVSQAITGCYQQLYLAIMVLAFLLSMFIALLYILLNGLVVNYVEAPLQPLSIGISSFTGSFFLLPRANIIGYYRDTTGNYDAMLTMFTCVATGAGLVWLLVPPACKYLKDLLGRVQRSRGVTQKGTRGCPGPYSAWQLDQCYAEQKHLHTNESRNHRDNVS